MLSERTVTVDGAQWARKKVSIPFKRDMLSEQGPSEVDKSRRSEVIDVSIPFKRDMLSEHDQTNSIRSSTTDNCGFNSLQAGYAF